MEEISKRLEAAVARLEALPFGKITPAEDGEDFSAASHPTPPPPASASLFSSSSEKPVMKAKNGEENKSGSVTAGSSSFSVEGPPILELRRGLKWVVENQIGRKNLVIDDCDEKQSVRVHACKNSVLHVEGKVKKITLNNCFGMGVVFQDVVEDFEIANCDGVKVQGTAPTVSVYKSSSCHLHIR